jgi:hypothetical protein
MSLGGPYSGSSPRVKLDEGGTVASSGPVPHYRAEVVFTFDMAALTDGGRRLHELSSAADSVGFSLERARVDEAPTPEVRADGWTAYAPLDPDPADPGPPITVRLDELLVGDLGNQRVDARLLQAILLRDQHVAEWLRSQGVDAAAVEEAFPGTGWR